jgi:large subunit ribosomal protein L32e
MSPEKKDEKESAEKRVVNKPTLSAEEKRLIRLRREKNKKRPLFVRTASHRYWRIGRRDSWRSPKGVQSKQRRHYGYRPTVVSIGFGGPKAVRGRTPMGFKPAIVHNVKEMEILEPTINMVIIARGVGTKKRLAIEQAAKKLGLKISNPLTRSGGEET